MAIYTEARDERTVTAADANPITLFTPPTVGTYWVVFRAYCTSWSSGTCNYVIAWTENGQAMSGTTLNTTGANQAKCNAALICPDAGTAVTVQLTNVTTATVDVSCSVAQVA